MVDNMQAGHFKNDCKEISKIKSVKSTEMRGDGIHIVGKCTLMNPVLQYSSEALRCVNVLPQTVFFSRIKINHEVYTTT